MQISKSLFLVCAAAVIIPLTAEAADTPAQAKAREALEQKYRELGSQTAPSAAQPAAPTPRPAAPAVTQPAAPAPKPAAPAPKAAPRQPAWQTEAQPGVKGADSETIARAREALRQKMAEFEATQEMPGFDRVPADPGLAATKDQEARALLEHEVRTLEEKAAARPEVRTGPAPLRGIGEYEAMQGPPVPFTQQQQAKLAELLRKYRADEITPEQYHAERARIIKEK
jgi:hypothetical protein